MSLPVGSPVLTREGVIWTYLGVGNFPQMRCNVNHTVIWSNSVPTSLCNRLYADGQVNHRFASKDASKMQLLLDTTLLQ